MRKASKKKKKLLEELKQPFQYLAWKLGINGEDREDTIHELYVMVLKNYKGNADKGKGWWFLRAKWYLLNRLNKFRKTPLANSISIDSFFKHRDWGQEGS